MLKSQFLSAVVVSALLAFWGGVAMPQSLNAPFKQVEVEPGDTLRGIAQTHLNDPDLWPQILHVNGIASVAELRPGLILQLPVEQVAAADGALGTALVAIQDATAQGAQLFAPTEIGSAIENRDEAVERRLDGAWSDVVQFSSTATTLATQALTISLTQRDRAAEALLTDVHGAVEGRTPAQTAWTGRDASDVLVEFERVRTLSASTAQITFRDLSRLRLNPNSNATIQTMRSDPLTGSEVTKVNLVEGDFYALLNQISDRTDFEIEVGGLSTTTNSTDFWVQNDQTGARFANYDEASLQVGEGENALTLGQNEGAVINRDGSSQVTDVLERAALLLPGQGETVFGRSAGLEWQGTTDAAGYWLEVASDPAFNEMQISEWGIRETTFEAVGLDQGRFHWRIAALDGFGLPGGWSQARDFELISDSTPPFLAVLSPAEGALLASAAFQVTGETEPEVQLAVNGVAVMQDAMGRFTVDLQAVEGANEVLLEAVDAAGNRTERRLPVVYRPSATSSIMLSETHARNTSGAILTRTTSLALRATTDASEGLSLRVTDAVGTLVVRSVVEAGGAIAVTLPASEAAQTYLLDILSPLGVVEGQVQFSVLQDATPPMIGFETPPPQASALDAVTVSGIVPDAISLTLDGAPVDLDTEGRFITELVLAAGNNQFSLVAEDIVGNVALRQVNIALDREAPQVLAATVSRAAGETGQIVITAEASDNVGLRPVARFELSIGARIETGFLRCDQAANACRAALPEQAGDLRLTAVEISDYAGNTTRFLPPASAQE